MGRLHLFEFCDLAWFPASWRAYTTDLNFSFAAQFRVFRPMVPQLWRVLKNLDCRSIIDLGSGSSGPLPLVQKQLEAEEHYPVTITLTDKFPNLQALRGVAAASQGKVRYVETSVDAMDVPAELTGFRTLFVTFHHFPLDAARRVLADAARKRVGIGVFEYTERSLVWFIAILLLPLYLWLTVPFMRPWSWERLLWTYLLPLPILFALWDGLVSCLRTYSPAELQQLTRSIECQDYSWEIGRIRSFGACRITYLFGHPTNPELNAS
ncbi:MAG: hypothetical protein LAO07_12275 [Acidobacteriia bacterium]|nr:hypothetical protein [Terriglobia bacterium]